MAYQRDISKGLQLIRALLLGRTWNAQNRFQDQMSPRPYPQPNLPGGCATLASENHYHLRDARRAVLPNQDPLKQIGDGSKSSKAPAPGKAYAWD